MRGDYTFGPFRLDPSKPVLWRGREIVPLTPKALALLGVLVEHAGDVVTKQELLARVWPDTFVSEANLSVTVAALRKALGLQADGSSFIQTVARRGYRFGAAVRGEAGERHLTLAVMPFQGIGASSEPHLGLGLADAVITRLLAIPSLRVRSTGSVAHYADSPKAPHEAAAELGVDAILDGTFQREQGRVLVSAFLVHRSPAGRPWAARFESGLSDLFALQDSLAEQVAEALGEHLAPARKDPLEPGHVPQFQAYEAHLRGQFQLARFDIGGLSKAFGHFGEAADLDPRYAAPRAGLAYAHLLLGLAGPSRPVEAWRRAEECAEQSVSLDPELPGPHIALALVALFRDWDFVEAQRRTELALMRAPDSAPVCLWRGLLRSLAGDRRGAVLELTSARRGDPLSPLASAVVAFAHERAGEPRLAVEVALRAVALHPDRHVGFGRLGLAYLQLGRAAEAERALRRAVELSSNGPVIRCSLARALAAAGKRREARAQLDDLEAIAATSFVSPAHRAFVFVALGDVDAALDRLEEAAAFHDGWLVLALGDPALDGLRDHPRLRALGERVFE
jgi:DNA-binding winged helix-turn-helix (wHTH) protein/tetratricopeptide (TPR) repeat protein